MTSAFLPSFTVASSRRTKISRLLLWFGLGTQLALIVVVYGCGRASLERLVRDRGRAVAPAVVAENLVAETAISRTYDVGLDDGAGGRWRLFVREPRSVAGRIPAVFLLAGIETGRASLDFVEDRGDLVLVTMDYPYSGPEPTRGFALLRALPRLRRMGFDALRAGVDALAYVAGRGDVDRRKIVVLGVSFGTFIAVPLGAYDPHATGVVLIYGGGGVRELTRRNVRALPWWFPKLAIGPTVGAFFGEFEPLDHVGRVSPRRLLMFASREDEMFPPSSARALYERAHAPKKLVWYRTGHLDLFDPELLRRLTKDVLAELGFARSR